ncbi:ABC transporter ATP-binding protein [Plastoroseomonas hellenica]|uniref:ABC transporter ATP-binding protein n=1 Tax=Plastoroseomonas hellenica TaxID=2687306 RepID=UPI001BAC8147|nr:ABC transporter ATP-binding protein [Plastoroseomonas hellenica]MBR0641850.1 ABC transporter ATP-binding protein [Plastoroseomonas hellenica]
MSAPLLEVRSIAARLGRVPVLSDVSLSVPARAVVALLGRNGVGKTTTLRTVMGTVAATDGRIGFAGQDITRLAAYRRPALGIGYVPQGRGIFPLLTVRENMRLGLRGAPDPTVEEGLLSRFPRLRERLAQKAGTMSGGEQQMLAIARALMTQPKLLILDEPTEGIMPRLVAEIRRFIAEIAASGIAVLLVEQNLKAALAIADHVVVMERGRTAFAGPPGALRADADLVHRLLGVGIPT